MAGRGAFSKTILECTGAFSTLPKCQIEFLRRFGFDRYDIPGDGNCFYRALAKYYELSLLPGHPALPKDYHKELRDIVVLKMCEDIDRVKEVLIINNNSNDLDLAYKQVLNDLRKDGRWNADNADPVHEYAGIALDRRIRIFNKSESIPAQRIRTGRLASGNTYRNIPAQNAQIVCYIFNEGKRNMGSIDLLRVGDGHYELLYPKNPAARAAINGETNNVGVPTGPPPAPKALEAPRLATILAAKSPAERAIADNCLRPLPVPARRATARKPPVATKASPIPNVTARKPRAKTSAFENNIKKAIAASLANTSAKVEAKKAPTPRRRPVVAPRQITVHNVTKALNAIKLGNNTRNRTSRKRPVIAPGRRSRSSSLENALKAIENANSNEITNNEREALELQRVIEESMMKFKIKNNNKNK